MIKVIQTTTANFVSTVAKKTAKVLAFPSFAKATAAPAQALAFAA